MENVPDISTIASSSSTSNSTSTLKLQSKLAPTPPTPITHPSSTCIYVSYICAVAHVSPDFRPDSRALLDIGFPISFCFVVFRFALRFVFTLLGVSLGH